MVTVASAEVRARVPGYLLRRRMLQSADDDPRGRLDGSPAGSGHGVGSGGAEADDGDHRS